MCPEMDPNTALFNLYVDFTRFFDNSDKVITTDTLVNKVRLAYECSIEELTEFCQEEITYWRNKRPKYIIRNTGTDSRGIVKKIQKTITYAHLDCIYDCEKSVKENSIDLQEYYSIQTLYRYVKERGLSSSPHSARTSRQCREDKKLLHSERIAIFKEFYSPNHSLRVNKIELAREGLDLSIATIRKWKELYLSI